MIRTMRRSKQICSAELKKGSVCWPHGASGSKSKREEQARQSFVAGMKALERGPQQPPTMNNVLMAVQVALSRYTRLRRSS